MSAPQHFTQEYYSPEALDAAWEKWIEDHGHFDAFAVSHMWHRSTGLWAPIVTKPHRLDMFDAYLRLPPPGWPERIPYQGPNELLYQVICAPCQWRSIHTGENEAAEAWHDHAIPGWRTLPVVPEQVRERTEKGPTRKMLAWIEAHYPAEAQQPGYPIRTERDGPIGGRHVPGYSPWGGYDMAVIRAPKPELTPPPPPTGLPASAEQTELF